MKTIPVQHIDDVRGKLAVFEHSNLNIVRNYFITDIKDGRGGHAHYTCQQYVYCVKGHCDMTLDDGQTKETIRLRPERGLVLVDRMVWASLYNFSDDCVISVSATMPYEELDYIRDYKTFLALANPI